MSGLIKRFVQICSGYRLDASKQKLELQAQAAKLRNMVAKENRNPEEPKLLKLINQFAEERVIPDIEAKVFLADQRLHYIDEFEAHGIKELEGEE